MDNGKILVIDDEKLVLTGFQRVLEEAGYDVKTFLSGKEAIEAAKNEKFDIVYTDLVMPEMNGIEICKEIKKISSKTEVILFSGHPDELYKHQIAFWHAGGRDEILRKPLSADEIAEATEKVLKEIREKERDQNG